MPGPIEPATNRGWSAVEKSAATSRATRAAAWLISKARSAWPYSPSVTGRPPKVSVSMTSTPTARYSACSSLMISGRVTTSSSLQPSSSGPPKSSAVRPRSWMPVPMAPS